MDGCQGKEASKSSTPKPGRWSPNRTRILRLIVLGLVHEQDGPRPTTPPSIRRKSPNSRPWQPEWWDPTGKFAPLHKFNPVRLSFIRQEAAARFGRDARSLRPFEGLSLLDIGCGGGLLSEPMARLGFAVTGADASEKNIGTARTHAEASGLALTYRATTAETLAAEGLSFDVVLNMEVVEHVADVRSYLSACASLVKTGRHHRVSPPSIRPSRRWPWPSSGPNMCWAGCPRGTHDWNRFLPPAELAGQCLKRWD